MSNLPPKLLQSLSYWTLCMTLLALATACSDAQPPQTQAVSSPSPPAATPASPSPTTSASPSPQSDPFEQAIDAAISASTITQSAVSQDDWQLVTNQWQKAIALLESVSASHPKKQLATEKIPQYQRALAYAQQQAAKPQLPEAAKPQLPEAAKLQLPKNGKVDALRFEELCLQKDSLSAEVAKTVQIMLDEVGTNDCELASGALLSRTLLILSNKGITDVSPLAGLTHLEYLSLAKNAITDVSSLSGLTNLQELSLSKNEIKDVSPLAGLTNLKKLGLDYNQITDVSPLAGLTNLTTLGLSRNRITDVSSLSELTNLGRLFLKGNPNLPSVCPVSPASVCDFN